MPNPVASLTTALGVMLACAGMAQATSEYTYKKNEYVIVRDGMAPNKRLSIAAHGTGEISQDDFHLYVMGEPAHTTMARLPDIGPDNILDTAADAYAAAWSADSRHVALSFRYERHMQVVQIFRIQGRRALELTGPSLIEAAAGHKIKISDDEYRLRSSSAELTWISPSKFLLKEKRLYQPSKSDLAHVLGAFGRPEGDSNKPDEFLAFSAQAVCELIAGDRYRVVDLKPGEFDLNGN